jgi:putative transposase
VFQINVIRKHNRWCANLTAELPDTEPNLVGINSSVGVDLGLLHFYALSDGTTVDTPRFLRKSGQGLAKLQRQLSRKQKGSKNRRKAKMRVAKCHEKIANQRKDFLREPPPGQAWGLLTFRDRSAAAESYHL